MRGRFAPVGPRPFGSGDEHPPSSDNTLLLVLAPAGLSLTTLAVQVAEPQMEAFGNPVDLLR
jgi:hypothetical protein